MRQPHWAGPFLMLGGMFLAIVSALIAEPGDVFAGVSSSVLVFLVGFGLTLWSANWP